MRSSSVIVKCFMLMADSGRSGLNLVFGIHMHKKNHVARPSQMTQLFFWKEVTLT